MRPKAASKVTNFEQTKRAREPLPMMPRIDQQQRPRINHGSLSPLPTSNQLNNKTSSDVPSTKSSMKYLLIFLGTLIALVTLATIAVTIYLLVVVSRTTTTTTAITSAPHTYQCDTDATGWFANTMPTTGTTVVGTVCYVWLTSNCLWSNSISVTNCGSFYVYGLIAPPTCKLRYCTI